LNEDDDDDEVGDFGDGEGASKTDDLVFAQFEKVVLLNTVMKSQLFLCLELSFPI
jgi:hypothetical protein